MVLDWKHQLKYSVTKVVLALGLCFGFYYALFFQLNILLNTDSSLIEKTALQNQPLNIDSIDTTEKENTTKIAESENINGNNKNSVAIKTETQKVNINRNKVVSPSVIDPTKPNFSQIKSVSEKKKQFFNFLEPLVVENNKVIYETRKRILEISQQAIEKISEKDKAFLLSTAKKYKLKNKEVDEDLIQTLLRRVDVIPPSMALAQAAIESAWGTSRFAVEGNNFFGQWCYKKGCGLIPAGRVADAKHEVAKFSSVAKSVESYVLNLNTHSAYKDVRLKREAARQNALPILGEDLAGGLVFYSQKRDQYVSDVRKVISSNRLSTKDGLNI